LYVFKREIGHENTQLLVHLQDMVLVMRLRVKFTNWITRIVVTKPFANH